MSLNPLRTVGDGFSEEEKEQIEAAARALGFRSAAMAERKPVLELNIQADRLVSSRKLRKTRAVTQWIFGRDHGAPGKQGVVRGDRGGTRYRPSASGSRPSGSRRGAARSSGAQQRMRRPATPTPPPAASADELPQTGPQALAAVMAEYQAQEDRRSQPTDEKTNRQPLLIAVLVAVVLLALIIWML